MKNLSLFGLLLIAFACSTAEQQEVKTYSIEQFYQTTRIAGGVFSDDETKLLVSGNETGIFNAYEINIADSSRKQITFSEEESIFAIDYVPGTNEILYSSDKGGNEISHIFHLAADGTVSDLTPGEEENAQFGGWSEDEQSLYYLSNKRDPRFFDLYKMKVGSWESELMYQNNEGLDIGAMTEDESMWSLSQPITTSNIKLFLYDRENDKMTEISQEPGSYGSSGFSKDNRFFYYITDVGKEFAYLVQYEIATGERTSLFEADWDVMYSYLSEKETFRVVAINEDGKNTLEIINNATGDRIDLPTIPDGDITSVSMAESEKQIRLSVGTSKASNNLYVYNFESKELKKLTETSNPEINPDDLAAAEVVRFPSFDGLDIPAIYYKPLNASADNPAPALVWVHGGPGGQSRVGYSPLIQYLVNHGYAILAVNNRGSSGYGKTFYKMDDQNHGDKDLKDCIWGKKWLQTQDYIDSEKIGIIGGSYGGYMTMAAMTFYPEEFNVGVNFFGVTNWLRTLKSIPPYWESFREALYAEMGDPYTADSVRLYNISPLFHADKVKNPIMVLQGANDPRVLQIESDEIVEGVMKNDVPVEYVVFPDEGHGFIKKENEIKANSQILTFLDKYLKKEVAD